MTGDQTQKRVNGRTKYLGKEVVEMSFKFSVVSFSSIKPREQLDTRYLHGSLISFELEKKEKN